MKCNYGIVNSFFFFRKVEKFPWLFQSLSEINIIGILKVGWFSIAFTQFTIRNEHTTRSSCCTLYMRWSNQMCWLFNFTEKSSSSSSSSSNRLKNFSIDQNAMNWIRRAMTKWLYQLILFSAHSLIKLKNTFVEKKSFRCACLNTHTFDAVHNNIWYVFDVYVSSFHSLSVTKTKTHFPT